MISVLIASLVWTGGPASVARASHTTFVVNSTADAVDAAPGDGTCATSGAVCTLRAAIQETNAHAGADTITLPTGTYTLAIGGTSENLAATGDLDINDDLIINGAGAIDTTVDGGALDHVFDLGLITPTISVTLNNLSIRNGSRLDGGGILNRGAAATLANSRVISNTATAGDGGGIYNQSGSLTVINSTISSNTASVAGGGINNDVGATLVVSNTTVVSNTATTGNGGGLRNGGGTATLTNSTLSGNSANDVTNGNGGGLRNSGGGTTVLTNVTITGNSARVGGGSISNDVAGTLTLTNTIVANSTSGGDCGTTNGGAVTNGGNNLVEDNTCGFTGGSDPNLGPLQDNGGPTLTHALLSPSPVAIDGGNNLTCPVTDQRGIARPQGTTCDIGAFEAEYNDAPVNGVPGAQSVNEDTVKVFSSGGGNQISISDVDAGGSAVQVTLTGTFGVVTLTTSGLTFSVGDGLGDATMTFTGTIAAINTALNGLSFMPTANYNGAASLQIITNDLGNTGLGGALSDNDTVTITVNAVNDAPTLDSISDPAAINEDAGLQTVNLTGIGTGAVNETQTLTVTAASSNPGLIPNPTVSYASPAATGSLSYTPVGNANGTAVITVTVQDSGGGVDTLTRTFTVNVMAVNDAPTLTAIADPAAILEDAGLQTVNLSGIGTGAANETQTLTVTAVSGNPGLIPNPTVSYASPAATGSLSYTPVGNANGTAVITVTVQDSGGGVDTVSRAFTVMVTAVNDAPSFTKGADQTVAEDVGAQTVSGWATGFVRGGGADEASQTVLAYLVSNDNTVLFSAQPAIATNGTLTFTPALHANGSATVTVRVQDNGGTANTGVDTSVAQTFAITVTAVNDAPVNTVSATQTTISGTALVFSSENGNQISISDVDASGAVSVTLMATNGTITLSTTSGLTFGPGDGVDDATMTFTGTVASINAALNGLSFMPTANFTGTASLQITTNDLGNTGSGGAQSDTDTVTITVVDEYRVYLPLVLRQP